MNKDKSVHIATGVWYELNFDHKRYHHFPCHIQYRRYQTSGTKFISALQSCEPVSSKWGADYDTLNGAKPRSIKELTDLTKNVCDDFLSGASIFSKIELPMISISMQKLINGATCYHGNKDYMNIKQDDVQDTYNFIYSKANCIVTPSNISDVLKQKIEHIHVVIDWKGILWNQQSKLDPNASLYVYNYDEYEDGGVYVKILEPDTEVVNKNLCLINPKTTRRMPVQMAELFRQKTASIVIDNIQSRNR